METAAPTPALFTQRNGGSDLFCAPGNGQYDENEDFGPETDVDMVDDVLLSPAIAAAKALVQGKDLDDVERQRQQMQDFDDPEDRSRDTPTPPAHEVESNANAEQIGVDSGEESEEEWNYIPGQETEKQPASESQPQDEDDMSSQLNPDAAEFVPVSPTRLLMLDDAIISASSYQHNTSFSADVEVPSELDFSQEISQRPSDLEYTNGYKHGGDDYFMRDNFSTLRNKVKDLNASSTCAELGDSTILSLNSSFNNSVSVAEENIPFDKMEAVQQMTEKENLFTGQVDFNNAFGTSNDPMTTSIIQFGSDTEDVLPGTPKSTEVEAPASPSNDDVAPLNQERDTDSPLDFDNQPKSLDTEGSVNTDLKRSESTEVELASRAAEGELHVDDDNEGFITEHRRSPPIDLTFKPITGFSDTNPFGALQTPSTPLDQFDVIPKPEESTLDANAVPFVTPIKDAAKVQDTLDFAQSTPTSFISIRSPTEVPVPFEKLESPQESLQFEFPPNANNTLLQTKLPESFELEENEAPLVETAASPAKFDAANLVSEESKILQDVLEYEKHSKSDDENEAESQQTNEFDMVSPVDSAPKVLTALDDIKTVVDSELESQDNKSDIEAETKEMKLEFESHIAQNDITPEELKNLDEGFEVINKEELASNEPAQLSEQIDLLSPTKQTNPFITEEDMKDIPVEEKKTDFISAIDSLNNAMDEEFIKQDVSPVLSAQVDFAPEPEATKTVSYQTLTPAQEPELCKTEAYVTGIEEIEKSPVVESTPVPIIDEVPFEEPSITVTPAEAPLPVEEVVATSKPVESPIPTIVESPVVETQVESEIVKTPAEPEIIEAPVETLVEAVESQVVTETLMTALEEKSEVPVVEAKTEITPSAATPPPTPAPGLEDKEAPKTDILVAAVAAAGAVAATAVAVKEKKAPSANAVKKPSATATKKPAEPSKPTAKVPAKAPAAKPAPTKPTTAKPASATKPTTTTAAKPAAAKPASAPATGVKKPASAAAKPASATAKPAAAKPTSTTAAKPAPAAAKQVPKQLSVSKTTMSTLKPSSKPSTPTSKPTTPTTPKSPMTAKVPAGKVDITKSPPKPAVRSTLTKPAAEKKPLTNGVAAKKPEEVKKPIGATKTATAARPATATKTATSTTKPATTAAKPAAAKPALTSTASAPKTKPAAPAAKPAAPAAKPAAPAAIKRPSSAPAPKPGDKTAPAKPASAKPAVNGKPAPAKPAVGVKKTDAKVNGKTPTKVEKVPAKKIEDVKKEEENESAIQEANVSTTNGFAEHDHELNGLKIEDAPILVDGVN